MKKIYSLLLLCPTAAISEMAIPPTLFFFFNSFFLSYTTE